MVARSALFLVLLSAGAPALGPAGTWKLPARAKITLQPPHWLPGQGGNSLFNCSTFKLTSAQIRQKFATYHNVEADEMHDHYDYLSCVIDGEISVDGKSYKVEFIPGQLVMTNWPDGQAHILGGKHDE